MEKQLEEKITEFYEKNERVGRPKKITGVSMQKYTSDIIRMGKEMTGQVPENLDFLTDPDVVKDWLYGLNSQTGKPRGKGTIRNYYSSIIVGLNAYEYPLEIRDHYKTIRNKMNHELKTHQAVISETSALDIKKVIEDLYIKVHAHPLAMIHTKQDIADLQLLTLLRLYERIPARNAMAELKFLSMETYQQLKHQPTNASMTGLGNFLIRETTQRDGYQYHISLNKYNSEKKHMGTTFSIAKNTPWGQMMTSYLNELIKIYLEMTKIPEMIDFVPIFRSNWNTLRPLSKTDLTKKFSCFFKENLGQTVPTGLLSKVLFAKEIELGMSKKLLELALA